MSKEKVTSQSPDREKKLTPAERERLIVLELADPGVQDENGKSRRKSHREVAEKIFAYELNRLSPEIRGERLEYRIRIVRETVRNFILNVRNLALIKEGARVRTQTLYDDVKGLNRGLNLKNPDSLFDLFAIHRSKDQEQGLFSTLSVLEYTGESSLAQPPETPGDYEYDMDVFLRNLLDAEMETQRRRQIEGETRKRRPEPAFRSYYTDYVRQSPHKTKIPY